MEFILCIYLINLHKVSLAKIDGQVNNNKYKYLLIVKINKKMFEVKRFFFIS